MQDHTQDDNDDSNWYEKPIEERLADLPRKLAGLTLQLETPKQLIDRDDIVMAASECDGRSQPFVRVMAAALLLCWPSAQRREGAPRYRGDVLDFGGKAYSFLLGHGATQSEILRAGGVAVGLCIRASVAQQQAAEEARGNSETPSGGGASSSSSPSRSASGSGGVASVALTQRPQGS